MKYRPDHTTPAHWNAVREFVIACVLEYRPGTPAVGTALLSTLTHYVVWAVFTMYAPLERSDLFHETLMQRWVRSVSRSDSAKRTYLQRLGKLAQALSPNPVVPATHGTEGTVRPYTGRDLAALDGWAATRKTPEHRISAHTLLGLGGGAGVRASEVILVQRPDIDRTADGAVHVTVRGNTPRRITVAEDWTWYFDAFFKEPPHEGSAVFPTTHTAKSARSALWTLTQGPAPAPSMPRLRDTWLLDTLRTHTLADALYLCGFTPPASLNRYTAHLTPSPTLTEQDPTR